MPKKKILIGRAILGQSWGCWSYPSCKSLHIFWAEGKSFWTITKLHCSWGICTQIKYFIPKLHDIWWKFNQENRKTIKVGEISFSLFCFRLGNLCFPVCFFSETLPLGDFKSLRKGNISSLMMFAVLSSCEMLVSILKKVLQVFHAWATLGLPGSLLHPTENIRAKSTKWLTLCP